MNDTTEKTASSLAIVEKKPQKTGGCVGIFFQLFDWNRRFAKKKLFSKKLLPPVRLKQTSKKFGGDEKQPKLRLIADENSGGFPNMKKNCGTSSSVDVERKHEMRAPGLVARLMGLESMPTLQREKSKKVQAHGGGSHKTEKFMDNVCGNVGGELNVEKGGTKHELRPQKLQKTSFCERGSMTTFGAETLPFKNVLSRSRKHHPKLPSPVKSPRNLSKKNTSKLIGAATRILEPGLQTARSKYALTYSNPLGHPPKRESVLDKTASFSNQLEDSVTYGNVASKGQQSCRNCGHLLDNLGSKLSVSGQPLIFASPLSHCVGRSCPGSERSELQHPTLYQKFEDDLEENDTSAVAPFLDYEQSCVKLKSEKSSFSGVVCEPQMHAPLSFNSNRQTQSQNQTSWARDSSSARSKVSNMTSDKVLTTNATNAKNFMSTNQSLAGLSRSRVPALVDNGKFGMERRICNRQNDSVLPGRKRRPTNLSRPGESSGLMNSIFNKQPCSFPHATSGKEMNCNVHSIDHQSRSGMLDLQERRIGSSQVDNKVVSFTFNSPVKQKTGIPAVAKRLLQNDSTCDGSQKLGFSENHGRTRSEKPFPLSGDVLGAILEQKLKELTCQGEDNGGNGPKKTTAMILQELISALTSEIPFQQVKSVAISDRKARSQTSSTSFLANAMKVKPSIEQPLDGEHLSPGSVLEAYSSDASCISSSLDDSFGYQKHQETVKCAHNASRLLNHAAARWDSVTSINTDTSSKQLVVNILNSVSEILHCMNLANCGLKGSKLAHAREVLLNAELAFGNAALAGLVIERGFSVKHLLVEELETLASILWMNFGCSLGIEDSKEANQLRIFALDSIIEYLDLRFALFPYTGSKLLTKLPLCINTNILMFEIIEQARKWKELSGYVFDELIEREMSHSLREWTQFETETFEMGVEISRHLLQILVEEIVIDLFSKL